MKYTSETQAQFSLFQMVALAICIASGVVLLPALMSTSATVGFAVNSQGTQIIIDDFTDVQGPDVVLPPAGNKTGSVADGNMLGDERDIVLDLEDSQSQGAGASIAVLDGILTFHQDSGQGAQALIFYDGNDDSADTTRTSGLNGVDLTNMGTQNAFEITVFSCSIAFNLTIVGFNGPTNSSELTKEVPQTQNEITLSFPFEEFTIGSGSGADFSNLGALGLLPNFLNTFTGELDAEFGPFTTTGPPPPPGVLFNSAVNATNTDLIVSDFGPGNPFNAQVAQPFEVPEGESWQLDVFEWLGDYNPNAPPSPTADIAILNNDNGILGEAVADLPNLPVDVNGNVLAAQLPGVNLPTGQYYIRLTGDTPIGTEMNVRESTHQQAFPYLYRNPGGALEPGCTDWQPGNQCGGSQDALAIALRGMRLVDGPSVMDDTYNSLGNTGINVPASAGVLMNDGPGQVVDFDATSAQNGAVNVAPDGGFTYDPPQGFEGTDTFSYTIMNNAGGTSTATAEIGVQDIIWFIDADPSTVSGSANQGTFSNPFHDLDSFNNAPIPASGQGVVILPETYTGNLGLDNQQWVVGGWNSNVTVERVASAGYPVSEWSNLHTIPDDFPPIIDNPDGPAITLAEDNTLSNIIFGDTPRDFAIRDGGRTVGSLEIGAVLVTTSGGALGILNGGDLDVDLGDILFAGNSTLIEDPYVVHVRDATGRIIMSTLRIGTAENPAPNCPMWLENSQTEAKVDTFKANIDVDESASPDDAVAIRSSGGGSITILDGFINATGAGIMDLDNTTIDVTLQELNSMRSPSTAVRIDSSSEGNMSVTGMTRIDSSGGQGIKINNSSISMTFSSLDVSNPGNVGIDLDTNTGNFTVSGSTSINDPNGTGIRIKNSGEDFRASFGLTSISDNNPDDEIKADGIDLTNNSSATFSFNGLSVVSEGGFGVRANDSGTLNIDSEDNRVSATGGAALDITNTNFLQGWTFTSLSSIGSPGDGIKLDGLSGDIQGSNVTIKNPAAKGISIKNSTGSYSFDTIDISTTDKGVVLSNNQGAARLADGSIESDSVAVSVENSTVTVENVDIKGATPVDMIYLPLIIKTPLAKARAAVNDSMAAAIKESQLTSNLEVGVQAVIGNRANVELVFEGNTVVSPGEGINITTLDTSEVLVTLSGNDISSDSSNFSLIQTGESFLRLDGFVGGDSAAVVAFVQENNVGKPTVSVSGSISGDGITAVQNSEAEFIPSHFELAQNFPNPFNPETTIQYMLPEASKVKLAIYNQLGQRIITLVDQEQQPGIYSVQWDGKNEAGRDVASGVYLYLLEAKEVTRVQKLALIR
jgi:hypothetical protein